MTNPETIYNLIGGDYNATRKADPYISQCLLALLSPEKEKSYIDIGCGTGNYTIALSELGYAFTGLDPSEAMLSFARQRAPEKDWLLGTAEKMPLSDAQFDGALAVLTIHHWLNLEKAFLEINRILMKGSRLVLFTALPEQMEGYWLNHYFPKMMQTSIQKMPGLDQIIDAGVSAGFHLQNTASYNIHLDLEDHFLYSGKMNAAFYLDDAFRKGISSFAEISEQAEIMTGLKGLASDIESGQIKTIQKNHQTEKGDYIFVVLTKTAHQPIDH